MTQKIIVALIVAVAVFFAVRKVVRLVRGKERGCSCGCQGCPATGQKECHCKEKKSKIK